ncbi:hypothetical protein GCM10019060_05640 [Novosphingobium pokkalii]|nr:hypothetical protein GCM10019060_05640 [Novosphingobium pokkalii]
MYCSASATLSTRSASRIVTISAIAIVLLLQQSAKAHYAPINSMQDAWRGAGNILETLGNGVCTCEAMPTHPELDEEYR